MKKFLVLLLTVFCITLAGCSSTGGATLALNSDGTVYESYYVPFPQDEIERLLGGPSLYTRSRIYEVLWGVKDEFDAYFDEKIEAFKAKIDEDEKYTDDKKAALKSAVTYSSNLPNDGEFASVSYTSIIYELSFSDSEVYGAFKGASNLAEEVEVEYISNAFTTTRKVVKDPLFDKMATETITLGRYVLNRIDYHMKNEFGEVNWNAMKSALGYDTYASTFDYTYIVPTSRLHSNANSVSEENGYYYHTWHIPAENLNDDGDSVIQIQYWTIYANRWVWYSLTFAIGLLIAIGTIAYSKMKREKPKDVPDELLNDL